MTKTYIKAELMRSAAELALGNHLPSSFVDDYPQKTYSAARVAQMMEKPRERSKDLAVKLRNLIDVF